jgi:Na+-transporting NADH:ubiquinone oxidoreductase subunit NqrB
MVAEGVSLFYTRGCGSLGVSHNATCISEIGQFFFFFPDFFFAFSKNLVFSIRFLSSLEILLVHLQCHRVFHHEYCGTICCTGVTSVHLKAYWLTEELSYFYLKWSPSWLVLWNLPIQEEMVVTGLITWELIFSCPQAPDFQKYFPGF